MTQQLLNHLWQSTLFAGVIGLLTLALRSNSARLRYWLWLGASVKFLIPFSLLVSLGSDFGWREAAPPSPAAAIVQQISSRFRLRLRCRRLQLGKNRADGLTRF